MNRPKTFLQIACALLLTVVTSAIDAQEKTSECRRDSNESQVPAYRIGRNHHWQRQPTEFFVQISIEPQFFTVAHMTALARDLNQRFCKESRIRAELVDDYRAASIWEPIPSSALYAAAERGLYYLDRATGDEYIEFSTQRGRASDRFVSLGKSVQPTIPMTYTGTYINDAFGYFVIIPPSFKAVSEVPKARESGVNILLSSDNGRYIWLGGSDNTANYSSVRWVTDFRLAWLKNESAALLGVTRRAVNLGRLRGERMIVRYKLPESEATRIEDFVVAIKLQKDDDGILYQIEMRTTESNYAEDRIIFDKIVRSWQLKPHR